MSGSGAHNTSLADRGDIRMSPSAARVLSAVLLAIGAVCVGLTLVLGLTTGDKTVARQALASYHVGFLIAIGFSLGAMAIVMILHQVNAGWAGLIRRQFENVMSLVWPCAILFIPVILLSLLGDPLWKWMDPEYVAGDALYDHKKPYLNTTFFLIRNIVYFVIWIWLAHSLFRYSTQQDLTGDKWLTAKARRMSSYGLLLFALTTAFAAFDWEMTLDFHWFSTMYGVYFFAANVGAAICLVTFILLMLRRSGRLADLVTVEHYHDLGKLMFGFVVFWAYISFSQYFLIWYANIPEETMWYQRRQADGWGTIAIALSLGRFILPFILLMPRPFRRSPAVLAFASVWLIGFHALEVFWIVRPQVYDPATYEPIMLNLLDVAAALGPVSLFLGLLVRKIASGPLVPLHDPRMDESLHHKNYI
ncbi:MAG: quinol:cytochrome C oxidoreductase [Phycisphaeraceae bacterium]|nr:MAG: quinol:cytochrome C oxidoreductase [Phycisphaeraceae bacterium]